MNGSFSSRTMRCVRDCSTVLCCLRRASTWAWRETAWCCPRRAWSNGLPSLMQSSSGTRTSSCPTWAMGEWGMHNNSCVCHQRLQGLSMPNRVAADASVAELQHCMLLVVEALGCHVSCISCLSASASDDQNASTSVPECMFYTDASCCQAARQLQCTLAAPESALDMHKCLGAGLAVGNIHTTLGRPAEHLMMSNNSSVRLTTCV